MRWGLIATGLAGGAVGLAAGLGIASIVDSPAAREIAAAEAHSRQLEDLGRRHAELETRLAEADRLRAAAEELADIEHRAAEASMKAADGDAKDVLLKGMQIGEQMAFERRRLGFGVAEVERALERFSGIAFEEIPPQKGLPGGFSGTCHALGHESLITLVGERENALAAVVSLPYLRDRIEDADGLFAAAVVAELACPSRKREEWRGWLVRASEKSSRDWAITSTVGNVQCSLQFDGDGDRLVVTLSRP